MFSGGIAKQHQAVMDQASSTNFFKINHEKLERGHWRLIKASIPVSQVLNRQKDVLKVIETTTTPY